MKVLFFIILAWWMFVPVSFAQTQQGTCRFNCTPQIDSSTMPCTQDRECAQRCTDRCPTLVDRGGCALDTARCADLGGGRKGCAFDCTPQIEHACAVGDAGTAECGRACNERCRPPTAGSGGARTATVIRCSGLAPTCVSSGVPPTTGTEDTGGGSSEGSMRLENPIRGADTIAGVVGKLVKGVLGIVGALALLMFVYGGIRWILSAGDPKDVAAAKSILKNATIGLFLIFFSYTLSSLVIGLVQETGSSSSSGSGSSARESNESLASCVQEAVRRRSITLNDARDRTNGSWNCRETTAAERATGSRTCIRNGCPRQASTVLCCAPPEGR